MNNLSTILRNRRSQLIAVLLLVSLLAGSFCYAFTHTDVSDAATDSSAIDTSDELTNAMMSQVNSVKTYEDYTLEDYKTITLNSNSGDIVINEPGTYVFTGTLNDGAVIVDSIAEENVRLVLDNANITCKDGAPIYVKNCGKNVVLSLVPGTTNSVTDGSTYSYAYMQDDEPSAAIFSNDDLRINGSGKLTVTGNFNDAISCDDDLEITEANIIITSVDDGIVGKDSVVVASGSFLINTKGDAVKSTNDEEYNKGYIVVAGGTFDIDAGDDGFHAESILTINDGNIAVTKSYEALEGMQININGGNIDVNATDDGINVAGGTSDQMMPGNDAMKAPRNTSAGAMQPNRMPQGEGGPRGMQMNGQPPQMNGTPATTTTTTTTTITTTESAVEQKLTITGGTIFVNADGDGIDVNGSAYMSGGIVTVYGPTNNGNGALDYDGVFEVTGGELMVAGSSGMAQTPSSNTTVTTIATNVMPQKEGAAVKVIDSNGKTVLSYTPEKAYSHIVITSEKLVVGQSYIIMAGSSEVASFTATAGVINQK